ncbi:hypothetical protein MKX03_036630 [Papaver bracteatum]|nr:hypothetical protein MKX03_036630 [Papaver bracteatum]
MASSSKRSSSSSWTSKQHKSFEKALAKYDKDTPDCWQNVANAVGGKSAEQVERHYRILLDDLKRIEAGQIPFPNYRTGSSNGHNLVDEEERLMKYLKLQ